MGDYPDDVQHLINGPEVPLEIFSLSRRTRRLRFCQKSALNTVSWHLCSACSYFNCVPNSEFTWSFEASSLCCLLRSQLARPAGTPVAMQSPAATATLIREGEGRAGLASDQRFGGR